MALSKYLHYIHIKVKHVPLRTGSKISYFLNAKMRMCYRNSWCNCYNI